MTSLLNRLQWHLPDVLSSEPLVELRLQLLATLLLGAAIPATAAYAASMLIAFQTVDLVKGLLSTILYIALTLLILLRNLAYKTRTTGIITLAFLVGFTLSFSPDTYQAAITWFLGATLLAVILLDVRSAFTFGLMSVLAMTIPWMMGPEEVIPASQSAMPSWLISSLMFITTASVIGWTVHTMIYGLVARLNLARGSLAEIEAERSLLADSAGDLERRLIQLHTVAEIARVSSAVLEPGQLYERVIELIRARFDLYYVGLFLLDEHGEYAVLHAGTGKAGNAMLAAGHRLAIGGSSMVGWAVANKKARIALDTGDEAIRFENPYLPLTQSELALPLVVGNNTLGALSIQSSQPQAFDTNDLRVLQSMADSLAIAIDNARLFQNLQASLREIEALNRQYMLSSWSLVLQDTGQLEHTYVDPYARSDSEDATTNADATLSLRGQTIGRLTLEGKPGDWAQEELDLIDSVALQASQALENARLIHDTQLRASQEQMLSHFTGRIRESLEMEVVLRTALRELGDRLDLAEVGAFFDWQDTDQEKA